MPRYSVTVSVTSEIDAESESDARIAAFEHVMTDAETKAAGLSAMWVDDVSVYKEPA